MMSIAEFKAWLEGYTLAGGKDVEAVKAKLAEVWEVTIYPDPINIPYVPSPTIQPWYPQPYTVPYTAPITVPYTEPYWKVWCGVAASGSQDFQAFAYNA